MIPRVFSTTTAPPPVLSCSVWPGISGPSSCQAQGSGFGAGAVTRHFVGVSFSSPTSPTALALNSIIPPDVGSASDSTLAHIWLSGGSRLIPSVAKSVPSGVRIFWFMLANCTSSAVSKLERHLCREYISRVAAAEHFGVPVPQVLHYFPAEIRPSYTNPLVSMLLGKPYRRLPTPPH